MANMLSEALDYANRGWYVFPCREKPGEPYIRNGETVTPAEKTPYTSKGLDDATLDKDQITSWWTKWQNAMIGINAGKSGLFVVDIDRKHVNGLDTFTTWNINDGAGLHSTTPSGGMHIIFTGTGKSSTNAKTGIDTRGVGGYFIAPPSKILVGENPGDYKRFDDWNRTPGVIPDGLLGNLFPDKTIEYVKGAPLPPGVTKQLSRTSLNFLANGAPAGERNSTLFKALADFAGCGYTKEAAKEATFNVAIRIGLTESEFVQVLEHAYSKPRTSSIPDSIQEKIMEGGTKVVSKITPEEQVIMEDALLATMLTNNTIIPTINDILNFDDFRILKNRMIYKAINRIVKSGMKADHITVSSEVEKESKKVTLDDISKLTERYFIDIENAITYARIIKEKSAIRKLESVLDNKAEYLKKGNLLEIINNIEKDVSNVAVYGGAKSTNVLTAEQASDMVIERTKQLMSGEIEQLKIGFSEYDTKVGGLDSNEMVVLAARSGDGKSALLLSILNNIALVQNKPCLLFSLEMATHESVNRLVCQLTGIPYKKVNHGKLSPDEWKRYKEAMERIKDSKLYFDDSYGMTVPEIRSKIRQLMEKDIVLVGIDQLEQIQGYAGMATHIRYDNIAYDVKNLTQEFNIPVILNHQFNRGITDRSLKNPEPQLADLNQAGEKPANQVWSISHLKDEKGDILRSKIKVLKNRNGPRIEFAVMFVGERMLFSSPAREEDKIVFQSKDYDDDIVGHDPEPFWSKPDEGH
jgi:replicative DNA helicase